MSNILAEKSANFKSMNKSNLNIFIIITYNNIVTPSENHFVLNMIKRNSSKAKTEPYLNRAFIMEKDIRNDNDNRIEKLNNKISYLVRTINSKDSFEKNKNQSNHDNMNNIGKSPEKIGCFIKFCKFSK